MIKLPFGPEVPR